MAYSDSFQDEYRKRAAAADISSGKLAKAVDRPVQEMLAAIGADLSVTDDHGWSALMWACAKGRMNVVKALLAAGADPGVESARVSSHESIFFHEGMDACAIATKAGNFDSDARRVAHFMFHTLNVDQRLLAAYRRLLLVAGLEPHMWRDEEGSPLAWLEIELRSIAACVPPVTIAPVRDRFQQQGFAWHGADQVKRCSFVGGEPAAELTEHLRVGEDADTHRERPGASSAEAEYEPSVMNGLFDGMRRWNDDAAAEGVPHHELQPPRATSAAAQDPKSETGLRPLLELELEPESGAVPEVGTDRALPLVQKPYKSEGSMDGPIYDMEPSTTVEADSIKRCIIQ